VAKNIRKHWLFSFLGLGCISFLVYLFPLISRTNLFHPIDYNIATIAEMFGVFIWSWITYHCAYRKRGTGWLMWVLISAPMIVLHDILKGDNQEVIQHLLYFHPVVFFITLIPLAGISWFWFNSLRLRKLNLRRKKSPSKSIKQIQTFFHLSLQKLQKHKLFTKYFSFIKKMANDKNNLKRGIYRIGILISFIFSGITLFIGTMCILGFGFENLFITFLFTVFLILLFFVLPLLLASGLAWIVEGFQKSKR